jgi:hypothetical protein
MALIDVVNRLAVEFEGEFSHDTVEAVVEESAASWRDATVQTFTPGCSPRSFSEAPDGDHEPLAKVCGHPYSLQIRSHVSKSWVASRSASGLRYSSGVTSSPPNDP